MPWVRAVATSKANPALASQAENAKRSTGLVKKPVVSSCRAHNEIAINSESIIPSKQRKAERRWVR